jgi:hypothetical protein
MYDELLNAVEVEQVAVTVPALFWFENEAQSSMLNLGHPQKLAGMIHSLLNSQVGKEKDWNALVYFINGLIHVFIGTNKTTPMMPVVFSAPVMGSC